MVLETEPKAFYKPGKHSTNWAISLDSLNSFSYKKKKNRLERWLSALEYRLLFQRTCVWFPGSIWQLTAIITLVTRDPTPSCGFHRHQAHTWWINIHVSTNFDNPKHKFNKNLKQPYCQVWLMPIFPALGRAEESYIVAPGLLGCTRQNADLLILTFIMSMPYWMLF